MTTDVLSDFTRQMFPAQPGVQVEFSWQGAKLASYATVAVPRTRARTI